MNTDSLARHYKVLTPWERLPLIVDAFLRDDQLELQRLQSSAPFRKFRVGHHCALLDGLRDLALTYQMQQLDSAVAMSQLDLLCVEEFWSQRSAGGMDQQLDRPGRALAFDGVRRADAWRLFCADIHVDPDALLSKLPGYKTVRRFEDRARSCACTAQEVKDYLRMSRRVDHVHGPAATEEAPIPTARELADDMLAALNSS
jgi:hypothetical protein